MIKIVIFGGSGKTRQLVIRRALDKQYIVTIVTRHPEKVPFQDEHLRIVNGDALDSRIVEPAVAAQDVVLSYRRSLQSPSNHNIFREYGSNSWSDA
jgi:putative NADH-flavin reductase